MSDSLPSGPPHDETDSLCETSNSSGDELEEEADDNMEGGWLATPPSFHLSLHTSSERATTDGGGERGIRHRSSSSSREGRANENSEEGEEEEEEGGLLMHWTDWSNESDVVGSSDEEEEEPLAAEARYPSGMSASDREAKHDGHSSNGALPVPSTNTNSSSSTVPPRIPPSARRSAAELSWIAHLVPRVSEDAIDRLVADALWSNEILISEKEGIRRPSYPLCVFLSESITRFRQEHHRIETASAPQNHKDPLPNEGCKKPSSTSSSTSLSRSTTISRCRLVLQQALLAHYQLSCEVQHLSRTASSLLDETQHHVAVDDTECATMQKKKKHHHDDDNTRFLTEFVGLWKCKMSDGWMHRHWRQLEVDALLTAHRIAVVHQQTRQRDRPQPQPQSFPSRPHEADDVDAEMLKDEHDSLTLLAIAATSLFRGNRSEAASGSSSLFPPPSPLPRSHHDAPPPPPPLSTPLPSCWFPRTRLLLGGRPSTGDDENDHGGRSAATPPPTTLQSLLDQWSSGVDEQDEDCSSGSRSGRNNEPLSSVRQQSAKKRVRLLFTNWLSYLRVALRWLLESAREALRELQQQQEEGVRHSSGEAAALQSIVEEALRSPGGWLFMTTTTALPNNNVEWLDEVLETTDSKGGDTEEESNRRRFLIDRYFARMTALKKWVTSLHDDGRRDGGGSCSAEEEGKKEDQPPPCNADGKRPTPITGSKRGVRLENCLRHSTRRQPALCNAITKKCGDKDDDDDDDAAGTNDDCDATRLERIYHRYRQASSDALHNNNNNYVGGEGLLSRSAAVAQLPSLTQRRNANLLEPMFLRLHDEADAADPLQSEQWEGGRALVQWLPAIRQFLLR